MTSRYSVSKAVITGGARGIGEAIALRLSQEGLTVSVLDVNDVGAKEAAIRITNQTGNPAYGFGCDVTDREQFTQVITDAAQSMGGLDTYIGNAGITRDGFFHKLTDDDWDKVIGVNLTGALAPGVTATDLGRRLLTRALMDETKDDRDA